MRHPHKSDAAATERILLQSPRVPAVETANSYLKYDGATNTWSLKTENAGTDSATCDTSTWGIAVGIRESHSGTAWWKSKIVPPREVSSQGT